MEYDLIISGGMVIDGTGADGIRADIAISDGRIARIGDLGDATAAKTIDASGKVVKNLQQPQASYPINTSVTETPDYLYIGSLVTPELGRLRKSDIEF